MDEAVEQRSKRLPWYLAFIVGRRPGWTAIRLIFWIAGTLLVTRLIVVPVKVRGLSMMPTYRNDTVHFINRLAYRSGEPQRGDVVAVRLAGDQVLLLKRVVGLPGEHVRQVNGRIYINGELLEEPWLKQTPSPKAYTSRERELGPGEYYVTGDNRDVSEFGKVDKKDILGRLWF